MRSLVPSGGNDKVYTPATLAEYCVSKCDIKIGSKVLEPASGEGAFLRPLEKLDILLDWCEIDKGRDFFEFNNKIDWVITNPPFSKLREFLTHSFSLADNIAILAPYTNMVTKARIRDMEEAGFWITDVYMVATPKEFPQSGFQLVFAIYRKTSSKLTRFHRDEL